MSTDRTIICEDCGQPYETSRPNTKVCSLCRLQRDLRFTGGQTRECWACGKEFVPINRNDKACGDCCYEPRSHGKAKCAYCGDERNRVAKHVNACGSCVRNPEHAPRFFRDLNSRIAIRRRDADQVAA